MSDDKLRRLREWVELKPSSTAWRDATMAKIDELLAEPEPMRSAGELAQQEQQEQLGGFARDVAKEADPDTELFLSHVRKRLAAGAEEYGDRSFEKPVAGLLGEIQQELEDVCGWSAILWTKINRLIHD